jgi:rubrerythrin
MFTISEILEIAIQLEKNGEKTYRTAISQNIDGSLKELLIWIADEENHHANWFANLKDRVVSDKKDAIISQMSRSMIDDYIGDRSFSLGEVDFAAIQNSAEMIRIFIGFEEDTIIFYEMLKAFIKEKASIQQLEQIIAEEEDHIRKLNDLLNLS